jgi:hypothetical protein
MRYEELILTISEIVNNKNINKNGLILLYELPEKEHIKMNEHLFYKITPDGKDFTPTDVFELEIGGILVRFIKKYLDI